MGGPQQNPHSDAQNENDEDDDIVYVDEEILDQLDADEENNLIDYEGEEELKVQEQEAI